MSLSLSLIYPHLLPSGHSVSVRLSPRLASHFIIFLILFIIYTPLYYISFTFHPLVYPLHSTQHNRPIPLFKLAPPEEEEMLHCLQTPENGPDLTVQRARLKWQQEHNSQQQQRGFNDTHLSVLQFQGGLMENESVISVKSDPEFETGRNYPLPVSGFGGGGSDLDSGNVSLETGVKEKTSGKKRKQADKAQSSKIVDGGVEVGEKRMRGGVEDDASKVSERENSGDNSRENSKVSEPQKTDYIHVRARRGQATDSHSLAERVRREKISERMKYLQELVPGCNKIIGKAGMLDEIINYVQSLQKQVEFLSMKLAAVNPRLDFNMDDFFHKEMSPSCTNSFSTIGMLSEMVNPAYIQLNSVQQVVSCVGLDMGMNPPEMTLERTTSTPVPVPGTFLESSCFPHGQPGFSWENDLQSIYNMAFNQGRTAVFPSQPFSGSMAANNLKMEM